MGEEASNRQRASSRRRPRPSSLKGLDRMAEAGKSRQEEWSAASCFQKLNIAKKWNLSSVPLCLSLSGIENPDEQTPCLLLQSPRISLQPFAASPKATHPAKEISQPCTDVQFRSGTRAESILSTSHFILSPLVSTFFPSPLSGWVVLPRWFLMVLKPLTL